VTIISFVGATIGRPRILPKQNPSPQGESAAVSHREIQKRTFFGGRAMLAPTVKIVNMH
jgi:hypothetical protein